MNLDAWHLHPQLADDTHPVASWPLCEVRLMDDSNHPWLILVPRIAEATEVIDLAPPQQLALVQEIDRAVPRAAGLPPAQAQRGRARQPRAAIARACHRPLPGRHRLAASGLGHGGRETLSDRRC